MAEAQADGLMEMDGLRKAGFNDSEVDAWRAERTRELQDAGFAGPEIQGYFGEKEPDMNPVKETFTKNLQTKYAPAPAADAGATTPSPQDPTAPGGTVAVDGQPAIEQAPVKEAASFLEAIEAGFDMSVTGLALNRPDVVLPEHAPMFYRIASQVGTLAGDVPAMIAGSLGGGAAGTAAGGAAGSVVPVAGNVAGAAVGGVMGAGAGAFALPEAMRTVMMQHYEKGDVKSFSDFWERTSAVAINSLKAGTVGALTAGVGGVVAKGAMKVAAPTVFKTSAQLAAEVSTMTTVGAALEGKIPEPQEFLDAAILVGGLHGAGYAAGKIRGMYSKTGASPVEVATQAMTDPKLKQEIMAENVPHPTNAELGPRLPNPTPPENFPVSKPLKEANPNYTAEVNTILSKVGEKGERAKNSITVDQAYTALVDKLDPINQATKALNKNKTELMAENNPYVLARVAVDSASKAKHFFEKGTLDFKTKEVNGPSLRSAMESVPSSEVLDAYMISKRVLEKEGQGIKSGFDVEAARKVVEQHKAEYEGAALQVTEFSNRALQYVKDAGIISGEQHARMLEANKDYVPFKRLGETADGSGKAGGKAGSLKAFKGSDKAIQSPILSIVENTQELIKMAETNRPKQALVELALKSEGQELITKVPPRMEAIKIKAEEIVRALEEQGAITTLETIRKDLKDKGFDVSNEAVLRAFEKEQGITQTGAIQDMLIFRKAKTDLTPNQFSVLREGKREIYETTPELAEAIAKLGGDSTSTNMLFKIANGITTVKKIGITFTPEFIVKNFMRDTLTASTFSKSKGINPMEIVSAMGDIWKKNDTYYEWLKSGGANGAFLDLGKRYIEGDIYKLQKETNFLNSARNLVEKPIDIMRVAAEISEQSLRVAEFKKVRKMGGSLVEGGMASREITIDFQRVGAKMSALNSITAFMNVSIQGLDRTARAFHADPAGVAMKSAAYITAPSVLLWWANKDDERYKEIPRWQKDMFWIIPTDNWKDAQATEADGLPEYMVREADGKLQINKGTIYRIPKPQELGLIFGTLPERVLEKFFGDDPNAMKEFDKSMVGLVTPTFIPDAVAPAVEQYFNKSFFTGRDIVPHHLQTISPQYQFVDYTSETAKTLGKMIATVDSDTNFASPLVLNNYIRSWGGALGQYALQVADKALMASGVAETKVSPTASLSDIPFIKSFVVRYPDASSNSLQDFKDSFQKSQVVFNTIRHLAKQGDFENMEKEMSLKANQEYLVQLDGINEGLSNQSQMISKINRDTEMSPDEKRQMIDGLYLSMTEVAKQGNLMLQEIKKSVGEK